MEEQNHTEGSQEEVAEVKEVSNLHQVTPLSKYLAMVLFIVLPFIGGWVGYQLAPEEVVEVEKKVIREVEVESESTKTEPVQETKAVQCVVDSDCALVSPDCEDCQFAAIGVDEIETFRAEKQSRCELNPPELMCDIVFNGEVKCINNSCQIVEAGWQDWLHKVTFVGVILDVVKKSDGYWLVSGGEMSVDMASYAIPDEKPLEKTVFTLIEDSYQNGQEYKLAEDVSIELISYNVEEYPDNRVLVEADELFGVYDGKVEEFHYYGLPSSDYPFEIIVIEGEITAIRQIYVD